MTDLKSGGSKYDTIEAFLGVYELTPEEAPPSYRFFSLIIIYNYHGVTARLHHSAGILTVCLLGLNHYFRVVGDENSTHDDDTYDNYTHAGMVTIIIRNDYLGFLSQFAIEMLDL